MAVTRPSALPLIHRLARIELTSADPEALANFYEIALGFERTGVRSVPGETASRLFGADLDAMRIVSLRLGHEHLDLVGFTPGGAPYPGEVPGWSPLFQHCAIIVSDMAAAYGRLRAHAGWRPISTDGPEKLPESSGGVAAFKFRDPEGHPLELLAFPEGQVPDLWRRPNARDVCLGIDHSAISVTETARSIAFYESLGYRVATRSHNVGPEQARMDAVADPDVAVTGLSLPAQAAAQGTLRAAPHIELLCYRGAYDRSAALPRPVDSAATRLVLETQDADALSALLGALDAQHAGHRVSPDPVAGPDGRVMALLRDPDGHALLLTAA